MSDTTHSEDAGVGPVHASTFIKEAVRDIDTPPEVELNGPGVFLQEGRLLAEFPLDELRTPKGIAFLLRHLLSKNWFSLRVARQWADALCKFLQ